VLEYLQKHLGSLLGDVAAAGSILGALVGWLPYVAAGLGILWYFVQFWESPLRKRWTARRQLARLEKLEREHNERASEIARLREVVSVERAQGV
jgi:hypothetical protein